MATTTDVERLDDTLDRVLRAGHALGVAEERHRQLQVRADATMDDVAATRAALDQAKAAVKDLQAL